MPTGGGTSAPTTVPTATAAATPTPFPTSNVTPTPSPAATPAVVKGPGSPLTGSATYVGQAWTPAGVASALDFPVQHGWDGTGQTVAIVIDSDVDRSVVSSFFSQMGIARTGTLTTVPVDGATPGVIATNGDQDEAYLDVETIGGLAPGANIIIYEIPTSDAKKGGFTDQSIADAYGKIESDALAKVVNSSFGGCEYANPVEEPVMQQGAAAGIAFPASAGDDGNVCDSTTTPMTVGANYPGSSPNAISVGGTETNLPAYTLTSNIVWNDASCANNSQPCAGGGGPSSTFALPSYQAGLAGIASAQQRNTPDVSMPGEDVVVDDGRMIALSGTSWSAPQYAALMAELYQYCNAPSGIANPVNIPYYAQKTYVQTFIDVVNGSTQFEGTSPFSYARGGYDDASGIGVPYGMALANTACPNRAKAGALLARSYSAMSAIASRPDRTFSVDAAPHLNGLIDRGERAAGAQTRVQIAMLPGAGAAGESRIESALSAAGFSIDQRFANHALLDVSAPNAVVERYFAAQLHDVQQGRFGTRYMPATKLTVPAEIAPYVAAVNADDLVTRHVKRAAVRPLPSP